MQGQLFDVVVSNPPYVRDGDAALESLEAEPMVALLGGSDGLDHYRRLAGECPGIIKPGGLLLLEHGIDQQTAIIRWQSRD